MEKNRSKVKKNEVRHACQKHENCASERVIVDMNIVFGLEKTDGRDPRAYGNRNIGCETRNGENKEVLIKSSIYSNLRRNNEICETL